MEQKQHYPELTVLSGIAILFVLGIHGCGSALKIFYPGSSDYANTGLFLRWLSNLSAPAVPMFLFVSGFKYAANDTRTPYFAFIKKRLPRVLMSFAILNTLFWLLDSIKYMESFNIVLLAKTYLSSWMGYSVAYQLWYIPMYCIVIALCPLVYRIIPSTAVRFGIYTVIGILQRILEVDYTIFATYPIRFVSYPVFFEMGVLVQEKNWKDSVTNVNRILFGGLYILTLVLLSWFAPEFSANGLVKYVVYYFAGTVAMYALSISLKNSCFLQRLGNLSYPIFLLHEPLIGGCVAALLRRVPEMEPVVFAVFWVFFTFFITFFLIWILRKIKWDRILWRFCLR